MNNDERNGAPLHNPPGAVITKRSVKMKMQEVIEIAKRWGIPYKVGISNEMMIRSSPDSMVSCEFSTVRKCPFVEVAVYIPLS